MEEAISNSIKELSIIIEPEPELSQVTEETIVTDNNTENNTVKQEHFGPLIVICKDLTH
jgi:acyl-CoA reductase-like NAD-dependent aldehyde dehydrogenase